MISPKTIRNKILISYLLLVFIVLSALGVGIYFPLERYFLENLSRDMTNQAFVTRTAVTESLLLEDYENVQKTIERIAMETNSRVTVVLRDGLVVGDTEIRPELLENHRNRAEIIQAFEGRVGVEQRFSNSTNRDMLYVAIPVQEDNRIVAAIRISYGIEFIQSFLAYYRKVFFTGLLLASLLAVILSYRVSRTLTEPIENINADLKEIAEGDYEKVIYAGFGNELGQLAENINTMSSSLREKMNEVDEEKNRLENIISTMTSGVIFLDEKGKIKMMNQVAQSLLHLSLPLVKNKPIYEVLRNYSLIQSVDKCYQEGNVLEQEITLMDQGRELYLKASFAPVYKEKKISGITILLTNLTEEMKLTKLKSDFVTNASHELRTPLTSVKGYSETLLNGAMEDKELREKFIRIIDKEADRLISLVEDLMNLSRIESTKNSVQKEIVDLKKTAYSVYDSFRILAAEKRIELEIQYQEECHFFAMGLEERVKQILVNFVDNAIKYTPEGGKVQVLLEETEEEILMSVKDNGIGLSKEDQERVFERFYRVDRSRNKKYGGFGLGLSIARNIAESLDGRIGVVSTPGEGSTFWLALKKAK